MTKEELEKEAEGKYCKGCKWRIEQCLWAWRKTNGLKEPNEKNCSCKEVPAYLAGAEPREKRIAELEAQIEKMKEVILDLLWFEDNLDPYMYECDDAQKGELLKPFDNARLFLEKYKCKKCKGEGIIKVGYNGWTTNPCPACEGKGYILRR